ncbi:DsbA family protein [Gryllotalpicola protaetiae]|uniref:Thioredoxin-like fold domain-containing protein n=1 Tax=Gryllotalpicola protaetiae TaxID=2419771 RepID=A0A387BSH3_9MICO|nr:hypothetical protein [Gryllotalpicola protaetiae]AYG04010.1 hypothetical protein D7I44_11020 [Gryllotalpicola protaetiae]
MAISFGSRLGKSAASLALLMAVAITRVPARRRLLAAIADDGQLARVPAVYTAVLAEQPTGETATLPDNDRLLEIAASSGVHVTSAIREAVDTGRWDDWVQHANDAAIGRPIGDTGVTLRYVPTVLVNGRQLEIREDGTDLQRLLAAIDSTR